MGEGGRGEIRYEGGSKVGATREHKHGSRTWCRYGATRKLVCKWQPAPHCEPPRPGVHRAAYRHCAGRGDGGAGHGHALHLATVLHCLNHQLAQLTAQAGRPKPQELRVQVEAPRAIRYAGSFLAPCAVSRRDFPGPSAPGAAAQGSQEHTAARLSSRLHGHIVPRTILQLRKLRTHSRQVAQGHCTHRA